MSAKSLSNLFWFFCLLCFLFITQANKDVEPESNNQLEELKIKLKHEKPTFQQYPKFYAAYIKVNEATTDSSTLKAIENCLAAAKLENFKEPDILKYLHLKVAGIHQSRWHINHAIASLSNAQKLVFDSSIEQRIKKLRTYLQKLDKERGLHDEYIATKNTGPAKVFKGKILVAYVFVDDGVTTRWSNKTKQRSLQVLNLVQNWQKEKAANYGINNISFVNRNYVTKRNPSFSKRALRNKVSISFTSSRKDIEAYVNSVAVSLGEKSIGDFIEKQMIDSGADQGVVFLHTNLNQRSFAQRCGYTHQHRVMVNGKPEIRLISKCKDEYVMLMEEVKRNRWDKMHYAQAHEMMHVFGAADLYNIKAAAKYSVKDIMNFQSKQLINSSVDPVTAYAIGWQEKPPNTPFSIIER
jgi:hypothetical protein